MATIPDGAAQVFAEVTRFTVLDVTGAPDTGASTFTTNQLLKATFTPVMETGVDLVTQNANGDIAQHFKHGDMPKYYTMQIEVSSPDPVLHNILAGGTVLTDSSTALTTPASAPTCTPSTTGGILTAGAYYYKYTAANQYGETLASAESSVATVTGTTGSVSISGTAVSGAVYYRWYGRTQGAEQFIGQTTGTTFVDTGAVVPSGGLPPVNTTAGPGGDTGYQSAPLGVVGNYNGISCEFWGKAVNNGSQSAYLPYWRWVIPWVRYLHEEVRTFQPNILENVYTGQAFENPSWGSGPFSDWQFDSTKVYQYTRAGRTTLPTAGLSPVAASA